MALSDLLAVVSKVQASTTTQREKRKAQNNPSAWRKIWEDALRKHYPLNVVSYTDRCAANLKRVIEKRGFPKGDMPGFLEWVVDQWQHIRRDVFSFNPKIPRGPEAPDMGFVIFNIVRLHAAYNAQKPEHALTRQMPAARLRAETQQPATPLPAQPINKPASALRAFKPAPARIDIDHAKAAETQRRLGLKTWDEAKRK